MVGFALGRGMAEASSDLVQVRESAGKLRELLGSNPCVAIDHEDPAGQNVEFVLIVELSWSPPIYNAPRLFRQFCVRIRPARFEGVRVKEWNAEIAPTSHARAVLWKWLASELQAERTS